jgi:crotonobetainyl-CoA:carnitine CoA-transferase CaiB-like acyl-CoA transferase
MDSLGLGYPVLRAINPGLIMVSISSFGQTGPYKDYKGCDLVAMATGGVMYICGDADKPPVRIGMPQQASLNASADGAVGSLIAYYYRGVTGEGQHVDISMQESVSLNLTIATAYWQIDNFVQSRYGDSRKISSGAISRIIWHCKDGYVAFVVHGGATGYQTNKSLVDWMDQEGIVPKHMKEMDWTSFDLSMVSQDLLRSLEEHLFNFFARHTKQELYEWAIDKQAMLYPVCDMSDILENQQLKAREFWEEVEHPELNDTITYPGSFFKSSEAICSIRRRAPLIGEHNKGIYCGELGITEEELLTLKQSGIV